MTTIAQKLSKKACLIGDFSVGKTSLVRRFVEDRFDDKYLTTIGAKVTRKVLSVETQAGIVELTIMLWDLAGGHGLMQIPQSYMRGAAGAILVCDMTRVETVQNLPNYVTQLRAAAPIAQLVFAANKSDLSSEHEVSSEEVSQISQAHDSVTFTTSAKTGVNVDALFSALGRRMVMSSSER